MGYTSKKSYILAYDGPEYTVDESGVKRLLLLCSISLYSYI